MYPIQEMIGYTLPLYKYIHHINYIYYDTIYSFIIVFNGIIFDVCLGQ